MDTRTMTVALAALLLGGNATQQTPPTPSPPPAPASAATPAPASAPAAPVVAPVPATLPADPALWVVKDKDTTIYLFGTIHVLKPGLSWFDQAVKKAFDSSDQLMLELVMPDPATAQAAVMKYGVVQGGTPLTAQLPEDKRETYKAELTAISLPPTAFDALKPWFAANNLTVLSLGKMGYDVSSGVEQTLTAAAKAENKPVAGLETLEQQLGYFDGLPQAAQIGYLVNTIDDVPKAGKEIGTMVDLWAKGNPDGLAKSMNESIEKMPELGKVLLADRNARWAYWISERMKQPGTVFIAVSAGHLAGKDSVQANLKKWRFKAKRIAY